MSTRKAVFSTALSIVTGTVMYILLNWIPVIGPVIVGFIAGLISKGSVKRRFFSAVLSAILGSAILMFFIFSKLEIRSILLWWIIILWNLAGIASAGIGSILSRIISSTADVVSEFRRFDSTIHGERDKRTISFNICPNCGMSNPDNNVYCAYCGSTMVREDDGV